MEQTAAEFWKMMEDRKKPCELFQHFKDDEQLQQHLKYVEENVQAGRIPF